MRNISSEETAAACEIMEGSESEIVITDSDIVPLEELDTSEAAVGPVTAKVM